MSISIKAYQDNVNPAAQTKAAENKKNHGVVKSVNAGGFIANSRESKLEMRKNNAKKQALKLITDAWKKDQTSAKSMEDMQGLKDKKQAELNDIKSKLKDIENGKEALREEYGVDSQSQEQKDLELLEKYQNNITGSSYDKFSEEEIRRLKELQHTPLTDYQKKVLSLNNAKSEISLEAEKKQYEIQALTESISDVSIDRLKSREMLDANDAADQIMDASNKEILGMLIQEGKENIDDKIEEEKEKAEKAEEKKAEQDERVEKAKEKRKEQEEMIEGEQDARQLEQDMSLQKQSVSQMDEAQKSLQKILKENHLINEDLKGIEIDLNF